MDLLWHAMRRRFGVTADFDAGLAIAAPWALAAAAGIAAFVWWQVEPVIPTAGPVVYIAWLLAALVARRAAIVVAIVATAASPLIALFFHTERPPLWIVMSLTALGLTARSGLGRPSPEQRLNILAGPLPWQPPAPS